MFDKEYRMLSFLPRWSIAATVNRQSVAEHSYYVALYASQIADALGIASPTIRLTIVNWALRHDAPEVWTSDMPGPGKPYVIDEAKLAAYIERFALKVPDFDKHRHQYSIVVAKVIKAADLVDEVMFLGFEEAMGNRTLMRARMYAVERLMRHVKWFEAEMNLPGFASQFMKTVTDQYDRIFMEGAHIPAFDEE